MTEITLFEKIIRRDIPANIVYEDDLCLAFHDIQPQAPVHILVIPKKPIPKLADATPDDQQVLGHLLLCANHVAQEQKLPAYRVIINNGAQAGQTVFHLHLHILGGRVLNWPPG